MLIIFIIFCLVIGYINTKTNPIFSMILAILGLQYFLNGNQLIAAIRSIVALPSAIVANTDVMFLIVIIILLFVLSNLMNLINLDFAVDRQVSRYPRRLQRLIVIVISLFATNLDFANSDIAFHHKQDFELNSGISPFINPISIMVIFISTLLVMFDTINGLSQTSIFIITVLNLPALWWFVRSLVNLGLKYEVPYTVNSENMHNIRPSIDIKQSRIVQTSLNGRRFVRRAGAIAILAILPPILYGQFYVQIYILSLLIGMILYTIYLGVKAVYQERIMAEEQIYMTIRDSILGIGPELLGFILSLVFASLAYDFLDMFYANTYTAKQLFVLAVIALIIGIVSYKDYLFGFAMALPITLIWVTSNYAIDPAKVATLYVALIAIATLIQILYLIDFSSVGKKQLIDIIVMFYVVGTTLLTLYLTNFKVATIVFAVYIGLYIATLIVIRTRRTSE